MQTRDYDDYVYVSSTLGFRKVNDNGDKIDVNLETDGYCNLYSDSIAVSYLHSMSDFETNAIHYFEEHHNKIFQNLLKHLSAIYANPKLELGFRHVNILDSQKEEMCFTEYVFIDVNQKKVTIKMYKDEVQV